MSQFLFCLFGWFVLVLFLSWKNVILDYLLDGCTLKWYGLFGKKECDLRKSWDCPTLQSFVFSSFSALPVTLSYVTPFASGSYGPTALLCLLYFPCSACKSDYWEVFINCLLHPLNYPPILPSLFKNVLPKLPEDMKVPCYATKRQKYISGRINTQRKGLEEFEGWGPPAAGVCTTGVTVGIWHTSFIFCMWAWAYLISEWISFSCAGGSSDTATARWCRVHQVLEKVEML